MNKEIKNKIEMLVNGAKNVYVSSVDENGYPNTKAMLSLQRDGMGVHYFSTNTSSDRVKQFRANPKACIYYSDEPAFQGVMFIGEMEVCTDEYHKNYLWREGFERYYSKGVTDEDYSVYKFTAKQFRYYPGERKTFDISELLDETNEILTQIITKFAESGWDLIAKPSKQWLKDKSNSNELISAIEKANKECGSCGCEFDALYKKALDLKVFI